MKKAVFILGALVAVAISGSPVAKADYIGDHTPACVVYVSNQPVPVSGECQAYTLDNGTQVFGYTKVNE